MDGTASGRAALPACVGRLGRCPVRWCVALTLDCLPRQIVQQDMGKSKYSCYGVRNVPGSGVFSTWAEAEAAARGKSGEEHKGFITQGEAWAWVKAGRQASGSKGHHAQRTAGSTTLNCSYAEKDQAKALGAQWDGSSWFVPAGVALAPFARWLPAGVAPSGASAASSSSCISSSGGATHPHLQPAPMKTYAGFPPTAAVAKPPPSGTFSSSASASTFASSSCANAGGIAPGELAVFTDGACKNNQRGRGNVDMPAGWGFAVVANVRPGPAVLGGDEVEACYGPVVIDRSSDKFLGAEAWTNNTGELSAICEALHWLIHHDTSNAPACICYDSEYGAKQTMGEWKANKNLELVGTAKTLFAQARQGGRQVRFLHIKGHSGHAWNDRADALANMGAAGSVCTSGRYSAAGAAQHPKRDADGDVGDSSDAFKRARTL